MDHKTPTEVYQPMRRTGGFVLTGIPFPAGPNVLKNKKKIENPLQVWTFDFFMLYYSSRTIRKMRRRLN